MRSVPIRLAPNDHPQGRRCPTVPGWCVGQGHKLEALQKEPGPALATQLESDRCSHELTAAIFCTVTTPPM